MNFYSLEEGTKLVHAARNAMELSIASREFKSDVVERTIPEFKQKHGVFVTIYHYPTNTLRGCVGFTEGIGEMKRLVIEAAVAAANEDPRFVPLSHLEFEHSVIEVSILSKSERMRGGAEQMVKDVRIGKDGLIVEYGYNRGLLLPIVAVEQGWSVRQFLENTCLKAGLPPHAWINDSAQVLKFSTQVFKEIAPRGDVKEVHLETL